MDFEQAIRILKEAQGDPARLGLASVDLLVAGQPDEEREKLRTALEVSAVPHWFDEKILAALLDSPLATDAEALAARLRRLPVVEPFPARGIGAANVHEATRLALRARMKAESPERVRALSTDAQACFAGDTAPHARIETLYHRFTAEPEAAARECDALAAEWDGAGRYEALLGLGVMLDELLQEGLPEGLVRGTALYWHALIRFDHQPLRVTAEQARAALEEYQRSGDDARIARSEGLLGDVLLVQVDLPHALDAYRASLDTRKRLAQTDPSDTTAQRDLSVSHNRVGNVLHDQGNLARALDEYRAGFAIRERLATRDPAHAGWQRDLSVSYIKVGNVRYKQGNLTGALAAFRAGLAIRERLTTKDPANGGWQRDLSNSHDKVGDVLRAQSDPAGALAEYRASLAIRERLATQDPANAGWQRNLSVSHEKVGDALHDQGDLTGALDEYRAGLAIREHLAAQDPVNAGWQRDLAISCGKVAEALLALPGGGGPGRGATARSARPGADRGARRGPFTDASRAAGARLVRSAEEAGRLTALRRGDLQRVPSRFISPS